MQKKGFALIFSFFIISILLVLAIAIVSRSISEGKITQRYLDSAKAFWLAEAGVNRALKELRTNDATVGNGLWATNLGGGSFSVDVVDTTINGQVYKQVTTHGFYPATSPTIERMLEVLIRKKTDPNFYNNAIYCGDDVDFNGNAYSVIGMVRYADTITPNPPTRVTGEVIPDTSISPLPRLDFTQLLTTSQAQGNVYVYNAQNKLVNQQTGQEGFPSSFWYDQATNTPNVIYVIGNLELRGNIGTVGGFFVVVGDVITSPSITQDATIDGNGMVEGAIYTRGEFRINGGGGGLNINGGVWAGELARLNGNAQINYNQTYMDAIKALNTDTSVQITSWKEKIAAY